jgi:hypothetical protein
MKSHNIFLATVSIFFVSVLLTPLASNATELIKRYCTVQSKSNGYSLAPVSCTLSFQKAESEYESFLETDCTNNGFRQEKFSNEDYSSPDLGVSTNQLKFIGNEIQARSGFIPTKKGLDPIGTTFRFDTILLSFSGDWFGPFGSGTFKGKCF